MNETVLLCIKFALTSLISAVLSFIVLHTGSEEYLDYFEYNKTGKVILLLTQLIFWISVIILLISVVWGIWVFE